MSEELKQHQNQTSQQKTDEIDLIELFSKMFNAIGKAFLWGWNLALSVIYFYIRNAVVITLAIIIAVGLAYSSYKFSKPYFETTATIQSNVVPNNEMVRFINNLHKLAESGSLDKMQEELDVSEEALTQLKDIQAFWEIDNNFDGIGDLIDYNNTFLPKDTTSVRLMDHFIVRIQIYDVLYIQDIKNALFSYINSNEYFQKTFEVKRKNLQEQIDKYESEIFDLDSLQKLQYFKEEKNTVNLNKLLLESNQNEDKQLFHDDIFELLRRKQSLELQLALFTEPIEIIENFASVSQRANVFNSYLYKNIPIAFILISILAFLFEKRKVIQEIRRTANKQ